MLVAAIDGKDVRHLPYDEVAPMFRRIHHSGHVTVKFVKPGTETEVVHQFNSAPLGLRIADRVEHLCKMRNRRHRLTQDRSN